MVEEFKPKTVVWAQFDKHPYWPARIASEEVTKKLSEHKGVDGIGVLFFGSELTYAIVPRDNIKEYLPNISKYGGYKSDDFTKAMKMASSNEPLEDPPLFLKSKSSKKKAKTPEETKKKIKGIEKSQEEIVHEQVDEDNTKSDVAIEKDVVVNTNEEAKSNVSAEGAVESNTDQTNNEVKDNTTAEKDVVFENASAAAKSEEKLAGLFSADQKGDSEKLEAVETNKSNDACEDSAKMEQKETNPEEIKQDNVESQPVPVENNAEKPEEIAVKPENTEEVLPNSIIEEPKVL